MSGGFWGRPPRAVLLLFLRLALAVSLLFAIVFVGADALTAGRADQVRVDFGWESAIPFVPEMTWVYSAIYLVFLAAPFVLRSRREVALLAAALAAVIVLAAAGFVLLPARLGYPPSPPVGGPITSRLLRAADRVNLDYNLVPSLHVALSATTLGALATRAGRAGRLLLAACAFLIGLSTLLTHQHHVVDVAAGYAVAAIALAVVYLPRTAGTGASASA